jgi:hypothetical protein
LQQLKNFELPKKFDEKKQMKKIIYKRIELQKKKMLLNFVAWPSGILHTGHGIESLRGYWVVMGKM